MSHEKDWQSAVSCAYVCLLDASRDLRNELNAMLPTPDTIETYAQAKKAREDIADALKALEPLYKSINPLRR